MSLTNIGTDTTILLGFKVDEAFSADLGSIFVQSTSTAGDVIVEKPKLI